MIDTAALIAAFHDYAHANLSHYDIGAVLYRLTDHVVSVLGVDGAGVSLAHDGQHLTFVTATDARIGELEEAQIQAGRGPCHEAFQTGQTVVVADLSTESRWPEYRKVVLAAGDHALLAIPMPVEEQRIGAIDVYRKGPYSWTEEEIEIAQLLANMASGYVINANRLATAQTRADQLQRALDSRVVIEQAKGILAERHDTTPAEAFQRLRGRARSASVRLHDLSRDVVRGVIDV